MVLLVTSEPNAAPTAPEGIHSRAIHGCPNTGTARGRRCPGHGKCPRLFTSAFAGLQLQAAFVLQAGFPLAAAARGRSVSAPPASHLGRDSPVPFPHLALPISCRSGGWGGPITGGSRTGTVFFSRPDLRIINGTKLASSRRVSQHSPSCTSPVPTPPGSDRCPFVFCPDPAPAEHCDLQPVTAEPPITLSYTTSTVLQGCVSSSSTHTEHEVHVLSIQWSKVSLLLFQLPLGKRSSGTVGPASSECS